MSHGISLRITTSTNISKAVSASPYVELGVAVNKDAKKSEVLSMAAAVAEDSGTTVVEAEPKEVTVPEAEDASVWRRDAVNSEVLSIAETIEPADVVVTVFEDAAIDVLSAEATVDAAEAEEASVLSDDAVKRDVFSIVETAADVAAVDTAIVGSSLNTRQYIEFVVKVDTVVVLVLAEFEKLDGEEANVALYEAATLVLVKVEELLIEVEEADTALDEVEALALVEFAELEAVEVEFEEIDVDVVL
ncbi:hypothetical protein EV368DRAFT_64037 [Lentinula lateritia]|nr:hypothetical protein EV368DRAFT_64037 [Lentinula lateritia]